MPIRESNMHREFLAKKGDDLDGRVNQFKLARRGFFEDFRGMILAAKKAGAGAATGTAGDENVLLTRNNIFEYHILGTQTIVAPVPTVVGLNLGMDQTDNDGVELAPTILANERQIGCFKVGTDLAFYCRAEIKVEDISGTDDLCVGFRKAEDYQANVDDYDEAAYFQIGGGAAARINIETILNGAATTTTDTTLDDWEDGETHELEVRVSGREVTYYFDGVLVAAAVAFSFDSGEFVVPFIYFLHSSDVAGKVELIEWECGFFNDHESA